MDLRARAQRLFRRPPRSVAVELAAIASVPLGLAAIQFGLPDQLREAILARPPHADLLTAYLTAYLHLGPGHLARNAAMYLAVAVVLYTLAVRIDQEQWLYLTAFFCLVGSPVLSNVLFSRAAQLLFPGTDVVAVGFSGVVSGLLGALFVAFLLTLRTAYAIQTVSLVGICVSVLSVWYTLWAHGIALRPTESFVALAAVLFPALELGRRAYERRDRLADLSWRGAATRAAFVVGFVGYYGVAFANLVPRGPVGQEVFTVLFHVVGGVVGVLFAVLAVLVLGCLPVRDHIRHRGHDPSTVL